MSKNGAYSEKVTLALPSKGQLESSTLKFLQDCGLRVAKINPRQYMADVPALPRVAVLFQRTEDIAVKVANGSADLGITGLDIVCEQGDSDDRLMILKRSLRYGHCDLVVAVPETWIDVDSLNDVADVTLDFREKKGRDLRIATKFPNLVRQFLYDNGITHFVIVAAHGAIEAAPALGYADIIADLTTTGTTLRENHLKPIDKGVILHSQACFIGNKRSLLERDDVLRTAKTYLEFMDAAIEGRQYYSIAANIKGASAEEIARQVMKRGITSGLQGPTIAPVYSSNRRAAGQTDWYSISIVVHHKDLLTAVTHLRSIEGSHVVVTPVRYVFFDESESFHQLLVRLKRARHS